MNKQKKWFFTLPGYEFGPFNSKKEAEMAKLKEDEQNHNKYSNVYSVWIDMNL